MAVNDPVAHCPTILRNRLAPIIASAGRAALIGFPENQNCGEHANWLGALKLLAGLGLEVVYPSSWSSLDRADLTARLGNGVVFLSNTLFAGARVASLAAELLSVLPNRTIVLPEAAAADASIGPGLAAAISGHPDLFIFARDGASRKTIEQTLPGRRVELAPPLAFMLGPQQRKADPEYDIVWIARTGRRDSSVEAAARLLSQSAEKLDLPEFPDGLDIDVVVKRRPPTIMLTDWSSLVFRSQEARLACNALDLRVRAQAYSDRGLHILSLARLAITDRAGAHVMCLLMRLPHVFLDEGTGVNRAFFETWSRDAEFCRFAETPARAWSQARNMLRLIKSDEP
jgi:exopolysaccharide biosynthesis predicted pyruvyltransferase EpsI